MANGLPSAMRHGVKVLSELSDSDFDALRSAFSEPVGFIGGLVKSATEHTGLGEDDARALSLMITSMKQAYPRLDEVEQAAQRTLDYEAPTDEAFAERVRKLLSSKAVTLLARATRLQLDNNHNFARGFVTTSFRPLLPNAAEDAWLEEDESDIGWYGSIVVSQLRLDFFDDNRVRSKFLALDLDDLTALRDVFDRAIKKHGTMTDELSKNDWLPMNPLGGE